MDTAYLEPKAHQDASTGTTGKRQRTHVAVLRRAMRQAEGTPGCKHRHDGQEARKTEHSCARSQGHSRSYGLKDGSYWSRRIVK